MLVFTCAPMPTYSPSRFLLNSRCSLGGTYTVYGSSSASTMPRIAPSRSFWSSTTSTYRDERRCFTSISSSKNL